MPSPTLEFRSLSDEEAAVAKSILDNMENNAKVNPTIKEIFDELNVVCKQVWETLSNPSEADKQRWEMETRKHTRQYIYDTMRGRKRLNKERGDRYLPIFVDAFEEYLKDIDLTGCNVKYNAFRLYSKADQRLLLPYMIKHLYYEKVGWNKLSKLNHRQMKKLLRKLVGLYPYLTWVEKPGEKMVAFFNAWIDRMMQGKFR